MPPRENEVGWRGGCFIAEIRQWLAQRDPFLRGLAHGLAWRCGGVQDSGVRKGNGDGTVPLISMGVHCRRGWRGRTKLNPSGFKITTRELKHDPVPMYQDPRCLPPPPAPAEPPLAPSSRRWM